MHRTAVSAGIALAVLLATPAVRAEPKGAATDGALTETLGTLRQGVREKPLAGPLAGIDQSPETQQAFNDLAAAVFSDLAAKYGGDPDAMAAALARGKDDPEGFAASLSPATRARLEKLAGQIDR